MKFLRPWRQAVGYEVEIHQHCRSRHHLSQESLDDQKFLSSQFPIQGDYYRG
jgi:hypothetical protein